MKEQLVRINVAIDGPAGAGKSTVARKVANVLGYIYVDTGAMYRAVTWKAIQQEISVNQIDQIIELAAHMEIRFVPNEEGQQVLSDEEDITNAIRTTEVTSQVSFYSQIKQVRELLVSRQQEIAAVSKGVVMDGRDIGTHVLPDAELKIFLTASVNERAERRYKEMPDAAVTMDQLIADIDNRDRVDEQRELSPLIQADDALLLDCTHMSIDEVVNYILALCRTIIDEAK